MTQDHEHLFSDASILFTDREQTFSDRQPPVLLSFSPSSAYARRHVPFLDYRKEEVLGILSSSKGDISLFMSETTTGPSSPAESYRTSTTLSEPVARQVLAAFLSDDEEAPPVESEVEGSQSWKFIEDPSDNTVTVSALNETDVVATVTFPTPVLIEQLLYALDFAPGIDTSFEE